jgi:elongation factor G
MGASHSPSPARSETTAAPTPQAVKSVRPAHSHRTIALLGPHLAGKTTLLEALLERCGNRPPAGKGAAFSVGDAAPEARTHGYSVELTAASAEYMGDGYTFLDLPGSVEFQADVDSALAVVDAAVVVFEPDPRRIPALQMILRRLEDAGVPHFLFLNKIDSVSMPIREILPLLQPASQRPLVLRQIPIWENGIATGFVDLALERAFIYREHAPSVVVDLPEHTKDRERDARFSMLERLADYDDGLMEQLLADIEPPRDLVFDDLARDLSEGKICPVLLGSAANGNGIGRLLKAIRHEVPSVEAAATRAGFPAGDEPIPSPVVRIIKTMHTAHGGKLSLARVLAGEIAEGTDLVGPNGAERIAAMYSAVGQELTKRTTAKAGDTVALGRLDCAATGNTLVARGRGVPARARAAALAPVFGTAIALADRKDEVKLSGALQKLTDEDPTLVVVQSADTHQLCLYGQGEMHMRVTLERLARKHAISVRREKLRVPYRETIRGRVTQRGRHKKQSGGHGQFGDCVLEIRPMPRGSGFTFEEHIVGGAIPRQFFSSVEHGVVEYLKSGPLGFPVVDLAVRLIDGSVHSVDSSDMAFRQAARIAMAEGLAKCQPMLLEPVMAVDILTPTDGTAKVTALIPQRRGQILRLEPREGWSGWDHVAAMIPAAELEDLIVELRSATAGAGTFTATFDHLAEVPSKLADQILQAKVQAAE